jgi:hypothetical protein
MIHRSFQSGTLKFGFLIRNEHCHNENTPIFTTCDVSYIGQEEAIRTGPLRCQHSTLAFDCQITYYTIAVA